MLSIPEDGFEYAVEKIFELEGGYSDDPADPGGPTRWGISSRAFPEGLDIKNLTKEAAKGLYKTHYWNPVKGDALWAASPPLALVVFDGAVQHGAVQSILLLQKALSLDQDGIIGAQTLRGVERASHHHLTKLLTARTEFYVQLIQRRPYMTKFRSGWFNRMFLLAKWVFSDLSQ